MCTSSSFLFALVNGTNSLWKEPLEAHQSFSSSQSPTVWHTIPVLECLQETWENMAKHPKFSEISDTIHAGLGNLGKWYKKTDNTDVYFICLSTYSLVKNVTQRALE